MELIIKLISLNLPSLVLTRAGSMGIISAVWHPRFVFYYHS